MKPKILTSILLFISAYSPLFLILVVKDFDFKTKHWFDHSVAIYVLLLMILLSIILLFSTVFNIRRGSMSVEVASVKNRSNDLINYTIPYMLAFFGVNLADPRDVIAITIFLLIILLLTITSKSVFLNPILALAGYCLYDLEYNYEGKLFSRVVISKHELHVGHYYYVRSLTRFLYFVVDEEIKL